MKTQFILLLILMSTISSCNTIKTMRLLKSGDVTQNEFLVEIPFEVRMGLIILPVTIQGKEYKFMFDTGAPNVISKELAAELNIKPKVSKKTGDSQGVKENLDFLYIDEIIVGGITFTDMGSAVVDLNKSVEIGCLGVDGLIGANLMRQAFWEIDYEAKIMRISSKITNFQIPEDAEKVSFEPVLSGTPKVSVFYNGIEDKYVTIDYGSTGFVSSTKAVLDKLMISDSIARLYGSGSTSSGIYGAGSADTMYYARVPETKIGSVTLTENVMIFEPNKGKTIGMEFFSQYRTILDWESNTLYLIPQQLEETHRQSLETFGFSYLYDDGKLIVRFVIPESEAYKQGIRLGDEIISINDENFENLTTNAYCEFLLESKTKKLEEAKVKTRRGTETAEFTLKSETFLQKQN